MNKYLVPLGLFVWHLGVLAVGGYLCRNLASVGFLGTSKMLLACLFAGLVGGVIYCLRGIYLNFCVRKDWDNVWIVWHVIRPVVSTLCGGVSYFFLKSGLLFLNKEAGGADFSPYVYYVLAFLAGYNAGNFLKWLEEIYKAVIGINKSKASEQDTPPPPDRS